MLSMLYYTGGSHLHFSISYCFPIALLSLWPVIFSALTGKQRRPAPDRSFCRVDAGQVIASNQSLGPGMAVNQCGRGWLTAWNLQDVENSQPGVPDDLANAKD